jgi:diadenosine tetraphosphatase ApaH/serine/threonine PP2A family protein phosphatase
MHNLLCLESKHCCVAGDLYPILEQYVPPRDSLCRKDNLSQHCLFRVGEGDAPIERGWMVPSGEL